MSFPRLKKFPTLGAITIADGAIYPIKVGGDFVRIVQADQSFTLRLDGDHELNGVGVNDMFRLTENDKFRQLEVVNDSGSALTFQLIIGEGEISNDGTVISGNVSVTEAVPITKINTKSGDTLTTQSASVVGTSSAEVVASSVNNSRLWLTNMDATAIVYWGASGVTVATGTPIFPETTAVIDSGASVHCISDTATTDVRVNREGI